MPSREAQGRGHRANPSYGGSISGQKAIVGVLDGERGEVKQRQLANAYQELGKELYSTQIKVVGNYTLGRIIGEGSFGSVRLALHRLTSTRCAIKQIARSATPPLLTREIHHHRRLHHPHVVQLYEIIATETHIWLAFELCAGGELFDYLVEQGRLSEAEARRVFGQLCLGLGYVHAHGVVHRDLKLENVLLDERCNVKIADFGFGREFEKGKLMDTYCGTTGYASPEMLQGRRYTGEEVDIWSLGVILYALLTGSLPFDDDDEDTMKRKIIDGEYEIPAWLSDDVRDLISKILAQDPRQRPTVREILTHAWFSKPIMPYAFDSQPPIPEEEGVHHRRDATGRTIDSADYDSSMDASFLAESQSTVRNLSEPLRHPAVQEAKNADEPILPRPRPSPAARSMSRSSSMNSPAIPFVAHSRTPSRTKRRSVGSAISERLLPAPVPPIVDYAAMMDGNEPEPFSTPLEKTLLENVAAVGFDTGQMIHSIRTNACDCSTAIWWQLKNKAEEKLDNASEAGSVARSPADGVIRRAKQSGDVADSPRVRRSMSPVAVRTGNFADPAGAQTHRTSLSAPNSPRLPTTRMRSSSSGANLPTSLSVPSSPGPTISASTSMPLLSAGFEARQLPEAIPKPPSSNLETSPQRPGKQRATSISIIQRATSVLTNQGASKEGKVEGVDSGRSTPLASLFGRKPSEKSSREKLRDYTMGVKADATVPPPPMNQNLGKDLSPESNGYSDSPGMRSESSLTTNTHESEASHPSGSHTSPASSDKNEITPRKQQARTSLFSSFKTWFNEDRKKRKTTLAGFEGSSVTKLRVASAVVLKRPDEHAVFTQSPLRLPAANSRRSSAAASYAVHSRRSSAASLSRQASGSTDMRRRSVDHASIRSVRSLSDAKSPPSRPASLISAETPTAMEGHHKQRRGSSSRHKRHGSTSSNASGRASPSHVAFRRAPTTATQVRRISRQHHRRDSASSSIRSVSSRRSSVSEDEKFGPAKPDHADIPEEEEADVVADVEEQRSRALRKLSGEVEKGARSATIFTAHKATSVFGSPALSNHGTYTRSTSTSTIKAKPKLRDVFKSNKTGGATEDEWVDEDDPLGGFGSGFGQIFNVNDAPNVVQPSQIIGSGRYAGLNEATVAATHSQGRPVGLGLKGPPPISEEEEEEE